MSATTYLIGGIATDIQLYEHQLKHIPNSIYLPFPEQESGDTMESYVLKFIASIDQTKPFNLIGCSMGGIMVMELLNHIHPEKVILISSVKSRSEMPLRLRQLKYTHLHKLLSGKAFIKSTVIGSRFLKDINATPGLREKVISMAKNNTPEFLEWCVHAIVHWKGAAPLRNDIIHLHGDKDTMFPIKNIKNPIVVKGGTHNMLLAKPMEITNLILKYLS